MCGAGCCSGGCLVSSMYGCHLLHTDCCGSVCSVGVGPLPSHLPWGVLTRQQLTGDPDGSDVALAAIGTAPGMSVVSISGAEHLKPCQPIQALWDVESLSPFVRKIGCRWMETGQTPFVQCSRNLAMKQGQWCTWWPCTTACNSTLRAAGQWPFLHCGPLLGLWALLQKRRLYQQMACWCHHAVLTCMSVRFVCGPGRVLGCEIFT